MIWSKRNTEKGNRKLYWMEVSFSTFATLILGKSDIIKVEMLLTLNSWIVCIFVRLAKWKALTISSQLDVLKVEIFEAIDLSDKNAFKRHSSSADPMFQMKHRVLSMGPLAHSSYHAERSGIEGDIFLHKNMNKKIKPRQTGYKRNSQSALDFWIWKIFPADWWGRFWPMQRLNTWNI